MGDAHFSDGVVNDFERRLAGRSGGAHVFRRCRHERVIGAGLAGVEQAEQSVLVERSRQDRRRLGEVDRQRFEQRPQGNQANR